MQQKQGLGVAMRWTQAEGEDHIAVVDDPIAMKQVGVVHQRDVMMAYRRAIFAARDEETEGA
ncbi:MAG: hypothetical protein VXZ99_07530 [Pseudomonadota bacterium]|nr:hypothetical protein [Pseudomonadota bacterium]